MLQRFLPIIFSRRAQKELGSEEIRPPSPSCPECGYILDRPHAARCSRCMAAIPQATGCKGCGRCRSS